MAVLGWFRADRRADPARIVRWRHVDGWVMRPSIGDRWALFNERGELVCTCTLAEGISHVQSSEQQPERTTA